MLQPLGGRPQATPCSCAGLRARSKRHTAPARFIISAVGENAIHYPCFSDLGAKKTACRLVHSDIVLGTGMNTRPSFIPQRPIGDSAVDPVTSRRYNSGSGVAAACTAGPPGTAARGRAMGWGCLAEDRRKRGASAFSRMPKRSRRTSVGLTARGLRPRDKKPSGFEKWEELWRTQGDRSERMEVSL